MCRQTTSVIQGLFYHLFLILNADDIQVREGIIFFVPPGLIQYSFSFSKVFLTYKFNYFLS